VCVLLMMTSACVLLTVLRRWRRLKDSSGGPTIELDDLVKVLCYTGRQRRRAVAKPNPSGQSAESSAVVVVPDHSEIVQLVLRSQSVGGVGLMQENERYSSAAEINAGGQN